MNLWFGERLTALQQWQLAKLSPGSHGFATLLTVKEAMMVVSSNGWCNLRSLFVVSETPLELCYHCPTNGKSCRFWNSSTITTPYTSSRELFQVPTSSQNTPSSRSSTPAHLSMQPARWIGWRTGIKDRKMEKWNKDVENKAQAAMKRWAECMSRTCIYMCTIFKPSSLLFSKCVRTVYRYTHSTPPPSNSFFCIQNNNIYGF